MPYNIVPLEAPSLTNAIGVFPEVSLMQMRSRVRLTVILENAYNIFRT